MAAGIELAHVRPRPSRSPAASIVPARRRRRGASEAAISGRSVWSSRSRHEVRERRRCTPRSPRRCGTRPARRRDTVARSPGRARPRTAPARSAGPTPPCASLRPASAGCARSAAASARMSVTRWPTSGLPSITPSPGEVLLGLMGARVAGRAARILRRQVADAAHDPPRRPRMPLAARFWYSSPSCQRAVAPGRVERQHDGFEDRPRGRNSHAGSHTLRRGPAPPWPRSTTFAATARGAAPQARAPEPGRSTPQQRVERHGLASSPRAPRFRRERRLAAERPHHVAARRDVQRGVRLGRGGRLLRDLGLVSPFRCAREPVVDLQPASRRRARAAAAYRPTPAGPRAPAARKPCAACRTPPSRSAM